MLKTSFDESFKEHSPGAVAMDATIEYAFRNRAREYDFLGNPDAYKLSWTSDVRKHTNYLVFSNRAKARLVGNLKNLKACLEGVLVRGARIGSSPSDH